MTNSESAATTPLIRTDIQGLRAIAVALVLVYHVVPDSLSGGFVGVDVFFVISGFLITLHLLGHTPEGMRDLLTFWSRRVRRLLPASLLVLGVTLTASRLLAPKTQWENTAAQTKAATLYVVNWVLADDAVDYLAAENTASPVQHFWSLSVEEQFYFIWPVLILLLGLLARRLAKVSQLPLILTGLLAVVASSLAYSIYLTATNPSAAYFVTPTRVWELGVGGLLACLHLMGHNRPRHQLAIPLAWAGLAAIAYSAIAYSGNTPFPGWQAAVPVLGTAAVIGAHSLHGAGSPGTLLALRPVQWLGDISYSVYLWHWPLVVLVPQVTGHDLTWPERGGIVIATLGLAALTKRYVEDVFRKTHWGVPLPKPFAVAALAMAVVVAGATLQQAEVRAMTADSRGERAKALASNDSCFGAPALRPSADCPPTEYKDLVPAPVEAAKDKSDAYEQQKNGKDCWSYKPGFEVRTCTFGDTSSDTNIVLVGNSHAGQWLPTLQRLATKHKFKVTTLLASQCALSEVRQGSDTPAATTACLGWVKNTTQKVIDLKPSLVVMTNRISTSAEGKTLQDSYASYGQGYRKVLDKWQQKHIKTLVLHDTPAPGDQIPDCITTHQDEYARCDGARSEWVQPEPARKVVAELDDPSIRFLDLNDHICDEGTCRAVNGGVITYFDGSHLTATYAATLSPYLEGPLMMMLGRRTEGS